MDHSEKVKRKTNPREKTNILSLLTFLYTGKLFTKGYKKDLEADDLYDVIEKCRSKICTDRLEQAYNRAKLKKPEENVSIFRLLWKLYGIKYIGLGFIHMTWRLMTSTMEPVAISNLVAYFKPGQTDMTINDATYYAAIMLGLKAFHTLYYQTYFIYLTETAIQIKVAFCSLIYRKALKINPMVLGHTSLGNIVTVITKDIQQMELSLWMFNDIWISIVQTTVICILVYQRTGNACFLGIFMLLALIPFQAFISNIIKKLRLSMTNLTDERLQRMQETLSTIKIVKMYTWEQVLANKIGEARFKEMRVLLKATYSKLSLAISSSLVARLSLYSVLIMYIWIHNDIKTEDIVYIMAIFGALRVTVQMDFAFGFAIIGQLAAALKRIENILELDEMSKIEPQSENIPRINLTSASLKLQGKVILKNVNMDLTTGLNIITGPLGGGKSTLIRMLMGDYLVSEGHLSRKGLMSYASQDPWLFPSSIKQNILFGEKFNLQRYRQVVSACALQQDFQIFEKGDETIVTDRGMNLSKGQQARINLARAVYRDSDIYLIDDALTALDTRVQEHIFEECIRRFLKNKCIILITHNPKHIQCGKKVIIVDNGTVKCMENQQTMRQGLKDTTCTTNEELVKRTISEEPNELTELLTAEYPTVERKEVYHEEQKVGNIDSSLYSRYLKMTGYILGTLLLTIFILDMTINSASQKLLSRWVNYNANITHLKQEYLHNNTIGLIQLYMRNLTTVINANNKLSFGIIKELETRAEKTINLYTLATILVAAIDMVKQYFILRLAMNASNTLHKTMTNTILTARMEFFDTFFIGNILNRFSQDLNVVDEYLPFIMTGFLGTLIHLLGIAGLIASVNWKFMLPAVLMATTSVVIRGIYIRTARSLKRLEAATRSPMIGHLNSTMEGLTTIRAYGVEEKLKNEFDEYQDLYTSAFYTSICTKGAFSFIMELLSFLFIVSVVVRFLFFDTGSFAGDVSLTLTQAGVLTDIINRILMNWSDLENSMTSVERAMEFTTIESETKLGYDIENWPSKGEITYEGVSLTYTNSQEKVLKDISFTVKASNKIGIVGRTGAGKSSIVSTLYRLYPYEGKIFIDGIELKRISLKFLRQHISIIPQDPIMFSGSIRANIDPLDDFTDDEIWKTLHKVELNKYVESLETQVRDVNFSTGQRQLICLARAIIRSNKILVLDEATSNMDPDTERTAQRIIDENFSSCSMLIIAHRLDSVLNCDKVMVLDRGEIVEFDEPKVLLKNEGSLFAEMMRNVRISHDK